MMPNFISILFHARLEKKYCTYLCNVVQCRYKWYNTNLVSQLVLKKKDLKAQVVFQEKNSFIRFKSITWILYNCCKNLSFCNFVICKLWRCVSKKRRGTQIHSLNNITFSLNVIHLFHSYKLQFKI